MAPKQRKRLDQWVEDLAVEAEAADAVDEEAREALAAEDEVVAPPLRPEDRAVEYVGAYLALKAQIADLELKAVGARAAAIEALGAEGSTPGKQWVFEGLGIVSVVKGRVTEKLDRARLARAGVDPKVLDAATVRTEGAPTVRIAPWTGVAAKGWKRQEADDAA